MNQQQADFTIYKKIYLITEQIPAGMVSSYGDVAEIVGGGCEARTVGEALRALSREQALIVPWQRVVSRDGSISTTGLRQRELLEAEGVAFDVRERAIMARHRWPGPSAEWAATNDCHTLPARDEGEQLSLF